MNKTTVGRCGECGGAVTCPTVFHSIVPPPPTCGKCGAVADELVQLPVMPMKRRKHETFTGTSFAGPWSRISYGKSI